MSYKLAFWAIPAAAAYLFLGFNIAIAACPSCPARNSESTSYSSHTDNTLALFFQQIYLGGSPDLSADGHVLTEQNGTQGSNGCWFQGTSVETPPTVSGGSWTVGSGEWGPDYVGLTDAAADEIWEAYESGELATMPCTVQTWQDMSIDCDHDPYETDVDQTRTVEPEGTVVDCRDTACSPELYISN